jgi:hypothetical protein
MKEIKIGIPYQCDGPAIYVPAVIQMTDVIGVVTNDSKTFNTFNLSVESFRKLIPELRSEVDDYRDVLKAMAERGNAVAQEVLARHRLTLHQQSSGGSGGNWTESTSQGWNGGVAIDSKGVTDIPKNIDAFHFTGDSANWAEEDIKSYLDGKFGEKVKLMRAELLAGGDVPDEVIAYFEELFGDIA